MSQSRENSQHGRRKDRDLGKGWDMGTVSPEERLVSKPVMQEIRT